METAAAGERGGWDDEEELGEGFWAEADYCG
jgi:hypothetical protein